MREREVIPDVRLQRRQRNVARVRQSVRLDGVGLAALELRRFGEIGDGAIELAQCDPAMSAMAEHARVFRMFARTFRENVDGLRVVAEVGGAASEPDDGVGVVRVLLVSRTCVGEVLLEDRARFRGDHRRGRRRQRRRWLRRRTRG
jgi:hypothetical protein